MPCRIGLIIPYDRSMVYLHDWVIFSGQMLGFWDSIIFQHHRYFRWVWLIHKPRLEMQIQMCDRTFRTFLSYGGDADDGNWEPCRMLCVACQTLHWNPELKRIELRWTTTKLIQNDARKEGISSDDQSSYYPVNKDNGVGKQWFPVRNMIYT
jgi:hypothetical protein